MAKKLTKSEELKERAEKYTLNVLKSKEFFICVFLFVFIALAMIMPHFWSSSPVNVDVFTSLYLEEFDKDTYANEEFCFDAVLDIQRQPVFRNNLAVLVNGNVVDFEKIFINEEQNTTDYSNKVNKNYCFDSNVLKKGNNIVSLMLGTEKVFFNIEKKDGVRSDQNYRLVFEDVNTDGAFFFLNLTNYNRFEPIIISVNGEIDHKVYPHNGMNVYNEKIDFEEGKNLVTVKFRDKKVSREFYYFPEPKVNPFLGALLFVVGFFVFFGLVFSNEDFFRKVALSLSAIFILLILIGFVLNVISLLSLVNFLAIYVILIAIIAIMFRKKISFEKMDFSWLVHFKNPLLLLVIFGAICLPLVFNVFTWSNYSYWNVYYERQSATLASDFSLPLVDDISFFGRPLGFIPGYFFLDAATSWMFGLEGIYLFGLLLCISNLFFLVALFSFSKAFNLSQNKAALFYIFMWMENFIRGALFVSPRHAISLGLFLIALMLLIENRKKVIAGITIGFCGFIQAPLLVAYPVLYLIIAKKIKLKEMIITTLIGAVTFVILFIPNLINFGLLSQAEKGAWGYLINYDPLNIFLDLGPLLVFFVLFILPDILKLEFKWDKYKFKLFFFAILGLLFQMYVSYRWNIFNTINIALFLVIALPEKVVSQKYFLRIFAILILIVGLMMSMGINLSQVTNYQTTAFDYVSENSSTNDRILNDPLFGHALAFFTERPIMADLAVEYAPQGQLDDVYSFLEDKNYAVIDEYNIEWTFSQSLVVNTQAFGSKILDNFLEFEKFDKVFTNSFFYVHWVGTNKTN